ncbi:MAG: hypothetical protein SFX72_01645 [Isosphaeraceae bacterium]|nr:hypothetical protein [Isosphaeraceae bacterium]
MSTNYEFTPVENELIGGLASKMRVVGGFNIAIGLLYLVAAAFIGVVIAQGGIPEEIRAKLPPEVKLPSDTRILWVALVQELLVGVFFLLIGIWTRRAAFAFAEIPATSGADISHLMKALGALLAKYGLIYTLVMIFLTLIVLSMVATLFQAFA